MKRIMLITISILVAASTGAYAGNMSIQAMIPSTEVKLRSATIEPANLPAGACIPGTIRVGPDGIPRICDASAAWNFLPGVFRQDGTAIALSDTTVSDYYFYLGPYGGTPDQGITIPQNGGIISQGVYGTDPVLTTSGAGIRLIWYPRKAAFRAGQVTATAWDNSKIGETSVAFGTDNQAVSPSSAALSGAGNIAGNDSSGEVIRILSSAGVVVGGAVNQSIGVKTFVGGGHGNIASGAWSTIGGGVQNLASGGLSFIGGGGDQTSATWNTASGFLATIAGGQNNTAGDSVTTIGGGINNTATGWAATVSGGSTNSATDQASVGGGFTNTASGVAAVIGGGANNVASENTATVLGGDGNQATGIQSTVLGGHLNIAGGIQSTVLGGYDNQANGLQSIAGGDNWRVTGDRTIVLGYPGATTTVAQNDAFILYPNAGGNVGIGTLTPAYMLDVNGNGNFNGNILASSRVGIGIPSPSYPLHIDESIRMEPVDSPHSSLEGMIYYHSSGAFCIYAEGAWHDLLEGAAGGACPIN